MNMRNLFLSFTLQMLLPFAAAQAATWHVDAAGTAGAIPSLQEALDRAADGDEILVADGEYGPVALASSKALLVRSAGGAENAAIAGGGTGRCATLCDGTGAAAPLVTLEGFTLSGGVDASDAGGGGVFGGNLVNCILRDNAAIRGGGASGARLENCLLTGNAAALAGGGASDSELVNCTVAGNRSDGTGGGVSGCELANSIVQANDSPDGADAVASLAVYSCTTPLLTGEGNSAADACFADAEAGDWRLAKGSPCLDAGDSGFCTSAMDLGYNGRIEGNAVDLGAYEGASETGFHSKDDPGAVVETVTITFNPNGGTCTPGTMVFGVGTQYSGFPSPTRPGYICTGWYTAANGGTRIDGNTVASTAHTTFYAHWARAVTIQFDPNGGTCNPRKKTFRVGTKYSGFPKPTRPGYVYTGWYTAPDGGTRINSQTTASISHKKFYAHWARAVTITFDPNGGTCTPRKKTFRVGAKYSGFPYPKRPGYVYTGWYTAPRGGTRINGKTTASISHKKFYAHWARAVTITFDPNGGTCTPRKKTFRVGTKYSGFPYPKRSGYVYIGWYTAPDGGTRINSQTVATTAHKKFYAHWVRAVKVSFDPNGGICSIKKKQYGLGLPFGFLPTPTRTGHYFSGWYTPENELVKTNKLVTSARTNLVAHWIKSITIHPVGDSMTYGIRTRTNPLSGNDPASVLAKRSNQGWRGYLKQNLSAWGNAQDRAVIFVGTHPQSSYKGNVPHDGYCGEDASSYARNHEAAVAVTADIQIVFLGMNDALAISRKGGNPADYFGASKAGYKQVLSSLHAGSSTPLTIIITEPKVTSLITEHNRIYDPWAINRVITECVNRFVRSQKGPKIKIAEIESLYSNASYTDDGFHLSVKGNQEVAARLERLIKASWK